MSEAGLPGPDFILWNASKHAERFCNTIAEYSGVQCVMRTLLCRPPFSLQPAAAKRYTLHGFRHIYITAMRQLEFPAGQINDSGHWRRDSEMPRVYDAAEATAELVAKNKVRIAIAAGWRRAAPGCLPPPSPVPLCAPGTPLGLLASAPGTPALAIANPSSPTRSVPASSSALSSSSRPATGPAPADKPVQVLNYKKQVLHKWPPTQMGTCQCTQSAAVGVAATHLHLLAMPTLIPRSSSMPSTSTSVRSVSELEGSNMGKRHAPWHAMALSDASHCIGPNISPPMHWTDWRLQWQLPVAIAWLLGRGSATPTR